MIVKDSQSNPNRAAQVAKDLIVQDKVDLMLVAKTPETTNPVCTQCEIEEVACVSTKAPWQPWFIGQQANPGGGPPAWKPFNYVYHYFWGLEDVIAVFTNMWSQVETNKSVGGLFPNDGDGNAWGDKQVGFPPALDKQGYKLIDPGRYQNLTDNFSAQITAFKNAQCRDRHRRGAAAGFHDVLEAGAAAGLQAEGGLRRQGDPVPGGGRGAGQGRPQPVVGGVVVAEPSLQVLAQRQSAKQLADAYEAATKKQWTQPIGFIHSLFEVATDVLKRTKEVGNAKATVEAIAATNLDTVVGKVAWNGKGVPPFAAKNVTKTPLVGGQWRIKDGNKYDIVITDNRTAPEIPVGGKMEAIA